jgi:hypothetical protein
MEHPRLGVYSSPSKGVCLTCTERSACHTPRKEAAGTTAFFSIDAPKMLVDCPQLTNLHDHGDRRKARIKALGIWKVPHMHRIPGKECVSVILFLKPEST